MFTIFGTCLWGEVLAGSVLCCILFCSKAFKSGEQIQWMFSDLSYLPTTFSMQTINEGLISAFLSYNIDFWGVFLFPLLQGRVDVAGKSPGRR